MSFLRQRCPNSSHISFYPDEYLVFDDTVDDTPVKFARLKLCQGIDRVNRDNVGT